MERFLFCQELFLTVCVRSGGPDATKMGKGEGTLAQQVQEDFVKGLHLNSIFFVLSGGSLGAVREVWRT